MNHNICTYTSNSVEMTFNLTLKIVSWKS